MNQKRMFMRTRDTLRWLKILLLGVFILGVSCELILPTDNPLDKDKEEDASTDGSDDETKVDETSEDDDENGGSPPGGILLPVHLKQSTSFAFTNDLNWGTPYDSIQRVPIWGGTSAIAYDEADIKIQPATVLSEYKLQLIEDKSDLYEALHVSVSVDFNYGPFHADTKVDFARETEIHEENVYLLIKAVIHGKTYTLSNEKIKPAILSAAYTPENFYMNFGDQYLYKIETAAEVYALLTINCKNVSEKQEVAVDVNVGYGSLIDVNTSVEHTLESEKYSKRTKIDVFTSGAVTSPIQSADVAGLIDSINGFISNQSVNEDAWQNAAAVAHFKSYSDLEGYNTLFIDITDYRNKYFQVQEYYQYADIYQGFFAGHSEIPNKIAYWIEQNSAMTAEHAALQGVINNTKNDYFAVTIPEKLLYSNKKKSLKFPGMKYSSLASNSLELGPYSLKNGLKVTYNLTYGVFGYDPDNYYPDTSGDYLSLNQIYPDYFPEVNLIPISIIVIGYGLFPPSQDLGVGISFYRLRNDKLGYYLGGKEYFCDYSLSNGKIVPDLDSVIIELNNYLGSI